MDFGPETLKGGMPLSDMGIPVARHPRERDSFLISGHVFCMVPSKPHKGHQMHALSLTPAPFSFHMAWKILDDGLA